MFGVLLLSEKGNQTLYYWIQVILMVFCILQIVFAATVTTEFVTGNSLFRKMELQGIVEAVGVCLGAMTCAAAFAWLSSARNKVGRIFTLGCNSFIDSVIDQIVDGLFYDSDSNDWSDDI